MARYQSEQAHVQGRNDQQLGCQHRYHRGGASHGVQGQWNADVPGIDIAGGHGSGRNALQRCFEKYFGQQRKHAAGHHRGDQGDRGEYPNDRVQVGARKKDEHQRGVGDVVDQRSQALGDGFAVPRHIPCREEADANQDDHYRKAL
ncbi:hypothetical protein D3C74_402030 [compost metagenome]